MSDEQLIELVKRYSVLYDISSSQYRDHTVRNNAWEEIAEELHITVETCKERWGKLRNCFTNALKRRLKKSAQASTTIAPWRYEAQMKFLLPHVEGRRRITNLSTNVNDESTEDSQFSEELESPRANAISSDSSSVRSLTPTSAFRRPNYRKENDNNYLKEMVDIMKSSQELRQKRMEEMMDETDLFLLSMSKRLRKLPEIDQSNIKFQIHKLIHDAEISMIKKSESYKMNTQAASENVVLHEPDPNVNRNQVIKYPNTLYVNTMKTETVNTKNETNTQYKSENQLFIEIAPSPNNTVEVDGDTEDNETKKQV